MLEVRGQRAVRRDNGPVVPWDMRDLVGPHIDHGLDTDGHAGLERYAPPGPPIVGHLRVFVRRPADAVPDQTAHDAIAGALRMALNSRRNIFQMVARLRLRD